MQPRSPTSGMDRRRALATLGSATLWFLATAPGRLAAEASPDPLAGLSQLSPESRDRLRQLVRRPDFTGQIPVAEVRKLMAAERKSAEELMRALLPFAQAYSRAPISNFHVAAIVQGASGALYPGSNLELAGHPLGFAVHGEQSALASAYMHAEPDVVSIAVCNSSSALISAPISTM